MRRIRPISKKRRERNMVARPIRERLIIKAQQCMVCGHSPKRPWPNLPLEVSGLSVHEIARGPLRNKALDQPCCCLVACWHCNSGILNDKSIWPEARQLAVLLHEAPDDFDLELYLKITSPNAPLRIEMAEVTQWWKKMYR